MKTVFITGITGFVGTNLVRYFSDLKDINIIGQCRDLVAANAKFGSSKIQLVTECSTSRLDQWSVDVVVHLAGIAHDLSGKFKLEDYEKVNYKKTVELYDQFLKSRATSFIFISSIKAARDQTTSTAKEDIIPNPVTEYGRSKLKAEQYLTETVCPSGKSYYIFRPCVIYGPGNKGNMELLYSFVKSGVPYPLGAYNNERSFLFIENMSFVLNEFVRNSYPSGIYHLSDGKAISTRELIGLISSAVGKKTMVWSLPKALVKFFAAIGSVIHLPFNRLTLSKLTENLAVANEKVEKIMGKSLPYDTKTGLAITYRNQ